MRSAHGGVLVRAGVGPFAQGGLDEALGLAVSAGGIGAGEEMAQSSRAASLSQEFRDVAGAIVGHDALDLDAQGAEVSQRGMKEFDGTVLTFIGHDAGEGDTGSIVDSDMDVFPACAADFVAAVAGDAVAGPLDASELFDIEVEELTGCRSLVAVHGRRRLQQRKAVESVVAQDPRDRRLGEPALARDLEAWQAQPAQREDHGDLCGRRLLWAFVRSRRAITQADAAVRAEAGEPFAHRALGDASLRRDELGREMIIGNAAHNGLSTTRGKSGIMMNVHVEVRVEDEDAQPQSLSSSSHEQCPETSHLERYSHQWSAVYSKGVAGALCRLRIDPRNMIAIIMLAGRAPWLRLRSRHLRLCEIFIAQIGSRI